ncbi:hypothetical protein [Halomonas piscis]|uniref:hypothetical protein n=1 Tax=Halomonas piscis TaxID=3031727 RepID=UPI0028A0455F|nr:hypothetical protein [Halomonas piscis]
MSLSAIIVMICSIIALWGVASWSLVYSMRQEEKKLQLINEQGGFEPFSPRAADDLDRWIEKNGTDENIQEMKSIREEQRDAMRKYNRYYYDWNE